MKYLKRFRVPMFMLLITMLILPFGSIIQAQDDVCAVDVDVCDDSPPPVVEEEVDDEPVWQPTLIETQSRISCNADWNGVKEYQIFWVNEFGVETFAHSDVIGEYGDISFVISPDSYDAPFLLNTYIDGVMVWQNWVDEDGNVYYTGLGDWNNLCERPLGQFEWGAFPGA